MRPPGALVRAAPPGIESPTAVVAHVGGLSAAVGDATVPSWLTVLTGGVVVGASFLFTSLLTDHDAIRAVNGWAPSLHTPASIRRILVTLARVAGLVALGLVVAVGLLGPATPTANAAILLVWVGWWAGYPMSVYLVGNTWPAVDPWRTLTAGLPGTGARSVSERVGVWPSVAGLLLLVWVEVVTPLASNAPFLALTVVAYTAVTVFGGYVYGSEWFERIDPVARVFRWYGRMAPVQSREGTLSVRLPGAALTDGSPAAVPGESAFVVALLWVTTYDGLVSTPAWRSAATSVVGAGVPPLVLYAATLVSGFGLFLVAFRVAAAGARRTADTYVTAPAIERWFAPALLPIAAGYHLAHFLPYALALSPTLVAALAAPLDGPAVASVLVVPDWFGAVELGLVVLGHLLAVWVAHALAADLFPGVLKPVRSQYPFVVVMVCYTMTSAWIVTQPTVAPPYV